jgi:hypothetical protein
MQPMIAAQVVVATLYRLFILDKFAHRRARGIWWTAAILRIAAFAAGIYATIELEFIPVVSLSILSDLFLALYLLVLNKSQGNTFVSVELQFALVLMSICVGLGIWVAQDSSAGTQLLLMFFVYRIVGACCLGVTPCDAFAFYLQGIGLGKDLSQEELGKIAKKMRRKVAPGTRELETRLFKKGGKMSDDIDPPVVFDVND